MKKAITLVVVLAALAMAAPVEKTPRTLTVTGTAEVAVQPDICRVSFGAETTNKQSAREGYRTNAALMNAITAAVKAAGIEAKDIQTSRFSVAPSYRYEDKTRKRIFDGYVVSQQIDVKVHDLEKVSAVLDAGIEAGATEIGSVTFTVENPKRYTAEARMEAARAAQAKAQTMAEVMGVKLGKPTSITESEPGGYGNYYAQANVMTASTGDVVESPSLQPGEGKLTRTVYVTYEIE